MPFLLRVELPDVPGSLGRLASAIGEAGGDIEAIEIVEKNKAEGLAVDDVLLETSPGTMPDSIVSACNELDGVQVVWISRYAAGGNLFLDLEAVEDHTPNTHEAHDPGVDVLPQTVRAAWAKPLHPVKGIARSTDGAPENVPFIELDRPERIEVEGEDENMFAGARIDGNEIVIIGRRGGPDFLDSELARLGHLASLATSIARS